MKKLNIKWTKLTARNVKAHNRQAFSIFRVLLASTVVNSTFVLTTNMALAAEVPNFVETRQQSFKSIETANKTVKSVLGQSSVDWEALERESRKLVSHSEVVMTSFPKESEGGKAKSDIWSKPEKFERLMIEINQGYQELLKASLEQNSSAAKSGLDKANGTCKACHRSYRSRW